MKSHHCFALSALLALSTTAAQAGGVAQSVGISGFTYTPADVQVVVGDTVDFAAEGFHPFKLDDDDAVTCTVNCNVTFLSPGTYGFYCQNHGGLGGVGMAGTVTVAGDPGDPPVFKGTFEHTLLSLPRN